MKQLEQTNNVIADILLTEPAFLWGNPAEKNILYEIPAERQGRACADKGFDGRNVILFVSNGYGSSLPLYIIQPSHKVRPATFSH